MMIEEAKKEYLAAGGDRFIVCAADQLEIALDDFVDEYEEAPDVYKIADVKQELVDWEAPQACRYTGEPPVYILV